MQRSDFSDYFHEDPSYGLRSPVYQVFQLAYCLHPHLYVARRVILEAVEYLFATELLHQRQRAQDMPAEAPYLTRYTLPALSQVSTLWELLQISILDVSEGWEKAQEGLNPETNPPREPRYQPTADVMLTRFIKLLAFTTMVRTDSYPMAVAFGSCLFTYPPREVCRLLDLNEDKRLANIARMKEQINSRIKARFLRDGEVMATKLPDNYEQEVMDETMEVLTLWGTDHFASKPVIDTISEVMPERQRKHCIMCPKCAGLKRLGEEWNVAVEARFALDIKMRVPVFPMKCMTRGNSDRFDPKDVEDAFLNDLRISIKGAIQAASLRRRVNPFRLFRVCVDGEEQGRFAGEPQFIQVLRIPLAAIRVQVFGQDDDGEVPLAVFYLPDLEASEAPQQMYHVTESGATIALTVWPVDEAGGETGTPSQARVQFWAEEALVPKTAAWYEAVVTATLRSLELAKVTGDTALETDVRQRLQDLHRDLSMSAFSAQGREFAALAERLGQWVAEMAQRVTQWVSALWTPPWAGVRQTAMESPRETHTFVMEPGRIVITCSWKVADQYHRASIDLSWQANFPRACDIWVQFRQPDTERVLAEIQLGTKLSGKATLTQERLGFDLAHERWGLAVVLKRSAA